MTLAQQTAGETGRDESEPERLDRNTTDLIAELRVAATGIQVLLAFLLIVPFNVGFRHVSSLDRRVYFASLICVAIAAALLIAPSIHHRLLFRRQQKEYILQLGTRFAITAMVFLGLGITGILMLVANVVLGSTAAVALGAFSAFGLGWLWFALPLRRRRLRHI